MSERNEEYIRPDGTRSTSRADAKYATPREVIAAALLYSEKIPPQFFLGTAQHETNLALNEVDTEPDGFVSMGIYQLSSEELKTVGMETASPYDLMSATRAFSKLQHMRLDALTKVMGVQVKYPDLWAYLAIAHNQGTAAALKTIKYYGMLWDAYKQRNPMINVVKSGYGDSCISGGAMWPRGWTISY